VGLMIMDEETLPSLIKEAIYARLEGWELVEFLNIPIESVVDMFETEIFENLEDVSELVGIERTEDEEDYYEGA
jgi:hypothetical protein